MKWGKAVLVVFGALIITALGIDAADTIGGAEGTLLSQVIGSKGGACPPGMTEVANIPNITCVDSYEASAAKECPEANPSQTVATMKNLGENTCFAESKKDATPWRFITRDQAMQMCARSGKRLPTGAEWYSLTLGMANVESTCNVSSKNISTSGAFSQCVSPSGAYDLIGNIWEWVSDDVINGMNGTTPLPGTGYVAQVDANGVATVVQDSPHELFEKDYFWSRADGAYSMIRGGYYDSGSDGGLYTVHADTPPTTAGTGIGFRCIK
jgi:formylglycine-generating enzyme required for sulfatase activity